jgi:hypothetical protein
VAASSAIRPHTPSRSVASVGTMSPSAPSRDIAAKAVSNSSALRTGSVCTCSPSAWPAAVMACTWRGGGAVLGRWRQRRSTILPLNIRESRSGPPGAGGDRGQGFSATMVAGGPLFPNKGKGKSNKGWLTLSLNPITLAMIYLSVSCLATVPKRRPREGARQC